MWIQSVFYLAILTVALGRHIGGSTEEETEGRRSNLSTGGTPSKRQLRRTHLRLHGKPPKTLRVREGDGKFLECQAGGTPAPDIHWLKDGILVPQGEVSGREIPSNGSQSKGTISVSFTTSRLYLDCVSAEDEGEYSCVAENPYHRISASTQLVVLSSDDPVTCSQKSHGQAPRMVTWTKTMIGSQGQPARLTCRADGYPRPTVRWLGTNEEELTKEDFSKYEILPEGDLIIREMQWTDMGTFTCIAENVHGEAKVEVFLYPAVPDK